MVKQLGAKGYINRGEFAGMMRKGGETDDEEAARFKESRRFKKAVAEILGEDPDFVLERAVQRRLRPTCSPSSIGKVVISGAASGIRRVRHPLLGCAEAVID